MAWLAGFTKRLKITIPSDNIDSTLTDFPILLKLSTDCGLTGFDASIVFDELELDANRFKIAVTASDGTTQRYVEIEKWDDSSEEAWLWVKVPSIAATGKTELYFYYDSTASDNTTYVGDIGDSAGQQVWSNSFWAVFHMGDTSSPFVNSLTTSGTNLNVTGSPTFATPAKVAEGVDWASGTVAAQGSTGFTASNVTVESWVKQDSASTAVRRYVTLSSEIAVIRQDSGASGQFKWYIKTGGVIRAMTVNGVVDTDWAYWAGTWDGTTMRAYKDGSEIGTPNVPGGALNTGAGMSINSATENFEGLQDEIRVSTTARTESWLKATYYTCNDNLLYLEEDVTEAGWLGTWGKRIPLAIDYTQVTSFNENLLNFPLLITLASGVGVNSADLTPVLEELYFSPNDNFTASSGSYPDSDRWYSSDSGYPTIINNKLRYDCTGLTYGAGSNFKISGDFDIQIDFDLVLYPSTDRWYFQLQVSDGYGGSQAKTLYAIIEYTSSVRRYRAYENDGGSYATRGTSTTSDTSGKIRITNTSGQLEMWRWAGSWISVGSTSFSDADMPMTVSLRGGSATGNPHMILDVDNFTVNAGRVDWFGNHPRFKKLAITAENGTLQQYVEIDNVYDTFNSGVIIDRGALLWTKVPVVSNTENTNLYLYYDSSQSDNTTYIGDRGENPAESVWDTNYRTVMHFNQTPTGSASDVKDSSQGNKDGTSTNMEYADLITTKIGRGLRFDGRTVDGGSDEYVDLSDWQDDYITVEVVVKMTYPDPAAYRFMPLFSKDAASPNRSMCLYYQWNGGNLGITFQCSTDGSSMFSASKNNNDYYNTWRYMVATYDGSYGRMYVDDTSAGLSGLNSGTIYNTTQNYEICARSSFSTGYLKGDLAELRVSNVARSGTYIRVNYKNLWDDLISYGTPETEPTPSVGTFNGYVKLAGQPVARTVQLYRRSTGELQDSVVSNPNTGYFEVETSYDELHYLVILPDISDGYQPIARDQIDPV